MQDPKKRKWVDSLAADVVYVSGRKRPPGEMNGKSGNINNVCSQLYPPGTVVPGNELICIFDADQVCAILTLAVELHGNLTMYLIGVSCPAACACCVAEQPASVHLSCPLPVDGLDAIQVLWRTGEVMVSATVARSMV